MGSCKGKWLVLIISLNLCFENDPILISVSRIVSCEEMAPTKANKQRRTESFTPSLENLLHSLCSTFSCHTVSLCVVFLLWCLSLPQTTGCPMELTQLIPLCLSSHIQPPCTIRHQWTHLPTMCFPNWIYDDLLTPLPRAPGSVKILPLRFERQRETHLYSSVTF